MKNLCHKLTLIFSILTSLSCTAFYSVKKEEEIKNYNLLYNTTSGMHRAQLITLGEPGNYRYVAKLSFVPYGEMPGRFRQSVLRGFEPGEHQNLENIVCHQAAEMTMYGMFQVNSECFMDLMFFESKVFIFSLN